MYYDDLVTIKYEPIEVVHSKRKSEAFKLHSCTIDELHNLINKRVESLREKGMTMFTLEFVDSVDDDDKLTSWCRVQGSRMETAEEMQERVRIYFEALQAMKEFQAAGVAAKTAELTEIEQQLDTALEQFRNSMREYGAQNVAEISTKLDQAGEFLSEQQKKIGKGESPIPIQKDILPILEL